MGVSNIIAGVQWTTELRVKFVDLAMLILIVIHKNSTPNN